MKIEIELNGKEEEIIRGVAYVLNKSEKEIIEEAIKIMIKDIDASTDKEKI